jgi:cation diffusion facilitator family transporter
LWTKKQVFDKRADMPQQKSGHPQLAAAARRVTWLGLAVNVLLVLLKALAGWLAHSRAVLADAVHSLSDLATDVVVLWGLKAASRQADEDHHFGHGRLETLAGAAVGLALVAVAVLMGVQAIAGIIEHRHTRPAWPALAVTVLSIISKEVLYRLTAAVGRRLRSQAMLANAWHHRSDALSSVAVLVGVGGAMLDPDWHILDQLAALVVSLLIVKVGWDISWKTICEMTDRSPGGEITERIYACASKVPGVLSTHDVKVRLAGGLLQMHVHVVVDGEISVRQGHDIADQVRSCIYRDIDGVGDVIVHVDPRPGSEG